MEDNSGVSNEVQLADLVKDLQQRVADLTADAVKLAIIAQGEKETAEAKDRKAKADFMQLVRRM